MTDSIKNSRSGATYLLQRAKSAGPSFVYKPAAPTLKSKVKRQPTVVVYVDENCPTHGSQGKCTCRSFITDENGLGSTDSLYQNGQAAQQQTYEHYDSNHDLVVSNVKPFNNNPSLPHTQRDVVGNNLYFNSSSQMNGFNDIDKDHLGRLMIYRDALKQNLTTPSRAGGGFPRMRYGRAGGAWPNIKQTNTYSGSNLLFIDGTVRIDNSFKYPMPRFGYPPMHRPQHMVPPSSSNQDLTFIPSSPSTKSLDAMTWSATDHLNHRPSISQYSNRYERHAKDGFAYWPTDLTYKKGRCPTTSTGTYKTWLGLSDAVLKL